MFPKKFLGNSSENLPNSFQIPPEIISNISKNTPPNFLKKSPNRLCIDPGVVIPINCQKNRVDIRSKTQQTHFTGPEERPPPDNQYSINPMIRLRQEHNEKLISSRLDLDSRCQTPVWALARKFCVESEF